MSAFGRGLLMFSEDMFRACSEDERVEDFCIEMAGVPVRIKCRFPANKAFLKDYLTDGEPAFTIEPRPEDLEHEWNEFIRRDARKGLQPQPRGDVFLESSVIYARLAEGLAAFGVLLMHGSALCMDGEAYVFTAPSGMGKSTHARLWREAFGERVWMINDDKPLLRVFEEKALVYGSPWDGKHHLSRNASAPLKAIVSLNRGTVNRIEPMAKAEAYPVLLGHSYFSAGPENRQQVAGLERKLLDRAKCYRLFCNMQPEAALISWQGMNEGFPRPERV